VRVLGRGPGIVVMVGSGGGCGEITLEERGRTMGGRGRASRWSRRRAARAASRARTRWTPPSARRGRPPPRRRRRGRAGGGRTRTRPTARRKPRQPSTMGCSRRRSRRRSAPVFNGFPGLRFEVGRAGGEGGADRRTCFMVLLLLFCFCLSRVSQRECTVGTWVGATVGKGGGSLSSLSESSGGHSKMRV